MHIRFDVHLNVATHLPQIVALTGDAHTAEKIRERVQDIAHDLLNKASIPAIASQAELLEDVMREDWWVDVDARYPRA